MKTLSLNELKVLVQAESNCSVSIYLSPDQAGSTRLKNLLREIKEQLQQAGLAGTSAHAFLEPVRDLVGQEIFWRLQEQGLALFLTAGFFAGYQVPYAVPEQAVVADGFHLKPLLPLVAHDGLFFILALSRNAVRLYRAGRYAIGEVPLEGVVQTHAEALPFDDPRKSLGVRRTQPGFQASPVIHGHGASRQESKEKMLRYFRLVNDGLWPYLRNEQAPLLLAGAEYHLPLFRQATRYPYLLEETVSGNPEKTSPDQLRQQGWELVRPQFEQAREKARVAIERGLCKDQAKDDLEEAVLAACQGRVDKCFVALDHESWGAFDSDKQTLKRMRPHAPQARDLLDLAATQTLVQGGKVFPVSSAAAVPGRGPLAVLLR